MEGGGFGYFLLGETSLIFFKKKRKKLKSSKLKQRSLRPTV